MTEEEKQEFKRHTDNKKSFLKVPETDNTGGVVLKSLSEQNVSNKKKVSAEGVPCL